MNEGLLPMRRRFSPLLAAISYSETLPSSGPEFQIFGQRSSQPRQLLILFHGTPVADQPALQPFVNVAGNSTALLNAVDKALL